MKNRLLIALLTSLCFVCFLAPAQTQIPKDKRAEIEKMLRLIGMEKLMSQTLTQMISSLKVEMPNAPEGFWDRFQKKADTRELVEKIIPLYDKYYTLEDLKAVNAFYESAAGQKILSTLPQLMQESMKAGQEWGRKLGEKAAEEVERDRKAKDKDL